ncbi:alpha/beta hydrolase [Puteibacter caeruleilacunae]|nr:alpha/beta hydrolase [Puteibacter caeruleilacunae]
MDQQHNINQTTINYRLTGEGMPIVWLHGMMMNMTTDDQMKVIDFNALEQSLKLLRFEAPAHGQSTGTLNPTNYQWDKVGDIYHQMAIELLDQPYIAAGFSMGSAAALGTAIKHPDQVKALILAMPPVIWDDRPEQAKSYRKMALWANQGKLDRFLPMLLTSTPSPVDFVEEKQSGCQKAVRTGMCGLQSDYYEPLLLGASQSDYPSIEEISKLKIPTLILGWKGDPTHPIKSCEELQKALPHAQVHIANSYEDYHANTSIVAQFLSCL